MPADGADKRGLAWDGTRSLLYVGSLANPGSIYVYADAGTLSGATAPTRTLTGGATALNRPRALFIDPVLDELYVANQGTAGTDARVTVFANASTAEGGPAPVRSLPTNPPTLIRQLTGVTVDFTRN